MSRRPLAIGMLMLVCLGAPAARAVTHYVAKTGSHTPPFTSWATAATNIEAVVPYMAQWSDDCVVSNGHYVLTNTVTLSFANNMRSLNGPAVTIVDGNNAVRCFNLLSQVTLTGFTIMNGYRSDYGAGIYANNKYCIADRCVLVSNTAPYGAAAYLVGEAIIRNSLIRDNAKGGVFCHWSGTLENCTVVNNDTDTTSGGAIHLNYGGSVINTISYYNRGTAATPNWHLAGTAAPTLFQKCNLTPAIGSPTCFTTVPDFIDAANGNYRVYPGAPTINAGTNVAWMASGKDLDGNPRVGGGTPDIGAYELTAGPLACSFAATPLSGAEPLAVTFTASAVGTNLTGLTCYWDVGLDGITDAAGASATLVTNLPAGNYTVSLTVSNAAGESATRVREQYVKVSPETLYVAASGSTPTPPYASWETAAATLQDAVNEAAGGTTVLVADGVYSVTSPVSITKAILVSATNTAGGVVIDGGNTSRCVYIENSGATLRGITLRRGFAFEGGGAYVKYGGTLESCIILTNRATYGGGVYLFNGGVLRDSTVISNAVTGFGGGIYNSGAGAFITNCLVVSNTTTSEGGGIYASNGLSLVSCTILGNRATWAGGGIRNTGVSGVHDIRHCAIRNNSAYWGGAMHTGYGTPSVKIYNCLLAGNYATSDSGALWTHSTGIDMQNCTVVSNSAGGLIGGLGLNWGVQTVKNCIVVDNIAPSRTNWYFSDTQQTISFSCTTPAPTAGSNNVVDVSPRFIDAAAGNYRLAKGSPCADAGAFSDWMTGAGDLDGQPRIRNDRVDMGAYESEPPAGTLLILR